MLGIQGYLADEGKQKRNDTDSTAVRVLSWPRTSSVGFGPLQKLYLTHEHSNPRATDGSIDIIRN